MTIRPISCNPRSRPVRIPGRTRSRYEPGFFVPETLFDMECSTLLSVPSPLKCFIFIEDCDTY